MLLTNIYNLPLSVSVFLASDDYDYVKEEWTISATSLLKSTRQIVLNSRLEHETLAMDISSLVSARMGSAYHSAIENAWLDPQKALEKLSVSSKVRERIKINPESVKPGDIPVYIEQRNSKQVGRWTITGKYDLVIDGQLEDFKSTSVWTYLNQTNADKYSLQGSIYKWLNPEIITSDYLQINYLFTDWSANQAKGGGNYPSLRVLSQRYPLLGLQETERFIKNKLRELELNWDKPEEELPLCTDEELWRKESVWKYYSKEDAAKASKNFDNPHDAAFYLKQKGKGYIKEVQGEVTACKFCSAFTLCSQKDDLIASGELKI